MVPKLSYLSTTSLTLGSILPLLGAPTWTPVYPSAIIAGNGNTLYLYKELIAWNVSYMEDHTKSSTTGPWLGITRQTLKSILLGWKLKQVSLALTSSSTSTAKETIWQIITNTSSGNIVLTVNGTPKKLKSSEKSESTQFTQLWTLANNEYTQLTDILPKCQEKQVLQMATYWFVSWWFNNQKA